MKINSKAIIILILIHKLLSADSVIDNFFLSEVDENIDAIISQKESNNKFGLIEKAKLSVEHSHFSDVERDYTLKIYTKGFSEAKNEENIYNLRRDLFIKKGLLSKSKALRDKYKTLIEAIYQDRLLTLTNREIRIEKKNLKITKAMAEKESDILKIYNIQDNIDSLKLKKFQLKQEHNIFLENISLISNSEIKDIKREINDYIFTHSIKTTNYISQHIDTLSIDVENNILLNSDADKIRLSEHKIDLIKAKNGIKLDSIQLKYDDSKKSKNAFSVGLSIEVPIPPSNSKIMNEKLKFLSLKSKADKDSKSIQYRVKKLKIDIKYLSKYLKKINHQITKSNISTPKNSYYKIKLSLKMRQKSLKLEKRKSKILYQILQKYITILYIADKLEESKLKDIIRDKGIS